MLLKLRANAANGGRAIWREQSGETEGREPGRGGSLPQRHVSRPGGQPTRRRRELALSTRRASTPKGIYFIFISRVTSFPFTCGIVQSI